MPAPAVHSAFGIEDFKIDARFLSHMAFLCSPDKPVETSTLIGNYAICEICVSEGETADIMMYLDTLRSPGQEGYVGKVTSEMRKAAAASRNTTIAEAADAMDAEFARLKSVFFVRVRSFVVIHTETNEVVGRILAFPGQISDDYGNNLEVHSENGTNQMKVARAHIAGGLTTLYIGHGQGAAPAQICAGASGSQAILFDGTALSELLVHNALQQGCVQWEPLDDEVKGNWGILHYRTDAWAKKQDATASATIAAARKINAEEKGIREAVGEGKAFEAKNTAESAINATEKEDRSPLNWFKKCEWITVNGIIPVVAQCRFARTGRYNAKALSDMIIDYTASMQAAKDPYV